MVRPRGIEPLTLGLEGRCSIRLSYGRIADPERTWIEIGRGREIRTPDILLPKQARYQTALYPDYFSMLARSAQITGQYAFRLSCQNLVSQFDVTSEGRILLKR